MADRIHLKVVSPGGVLLAGLDNGINYLFAGDDETRVVNRLPFNPLKEDALREDGLTLDDQLLQTLHDLLHHQHHHLEVGQLAVLRHVAAEALQVERRLGVHLRIPLAEVRRRFIFVLSQIHDHCNFSYCHNS